MDWTARAASASQASPTIHETPGDITKGAFGFGAFPIPLVVGQKYPTGFELLRQNDVATDIWIIDAGMVKLVYSGEDGRDLIVGVRLKGWILGSASVILQRPSPVAAFTMTPCYLQRLDAATFLEMLSGNSRLSSWLLKLYSQEVFDQLVSFTQATALSARQRLEQLLAQLIELSENNDRCVEVRVPLPFSHRDLAGVLGITPEHLSRLFRQLTDEGFIRREKGWIVVTDPRKFQVSWPSSPSPTVDIYQDRR